MFNLPILSKWLRSTEVVHYLGKIEVGSSILPGASIYTRGSVGQRNCLLSSRSVVRIHSGIPGVEASACRGSASGATSSVGRLE